MDRAEAIEILKNERREYIVDGRERKLDRVIDIAIEALNERSEIIKCKNCRHDNNCEIQYAAQAGSDFFCGAAERRVEDNDN